MENDINKDTEQRESLTASVDRVGIGSSKESIVRLLVVASVWHQSDNFVSEKSEIYPPACLRDIGL